MLKIVNCKCIINSSSAIFFLNDRMTIELHKTETKIFNSRIITHGDDKSFILYRRYVFVLKIIPVYAFIQQFNVRNTALVLKSSYELFKEINENRKYIVVWPKISKCTRVAKRFQTINSVKIYYGSSPTSILQVNNILI